MEPITASFATIVGLISDFVSSRRGQEARDYDAYIDWLRRQEHQQLADQIAANTELAKAIQKLLSGQHAEVLAKLDSMDKTLNAIASHFPDFTAIALAVCPDSVLSDQAVSILHQMNEAQASRFVESCTNAGDSYHLADGKRGRLTIAESRFIEDDLMTLCELGLLRLDHGTNCRIFIITRNGSIVGQ